MGISSEQELNAPVDNAGRSFCPQEAGANFTWDCVHFNLRSVFEGGGREGSWREGQRRNLRKRESENRAIYKMKRRRSEIWKQWREEEKPGCVSASRQAFLARMHQSLWAGTDLNTCSCHMMKSHVEDLEETLRSLSGLNHQGLIHVLLSIVKYSVFF